jgi:type I restriction enzyme S subunit
MSTQTKTIWRKVKLGEVADVKTGSTDVKDAVKHGGYPLFDRSMEIKKSNKYLFDGTAIILPGEGREFFPRFYTGKFDLHQRAYAIFAHKSEIDPRYLYYAVLKEKHIFSLWAVGSTVKSLRMPIIKAVEFYLPPKEIQKLIAEILSAFDDKIELNNKISRTLEQMAQAIFREWFGENSKFKNQNAKLSELVKTQYGYTESANEKEIGPKFLRVMDINKTNWIDWSSVPYCKISSKNFSKYKLSKGDVVIARMADPGKVAIVEEDINAVFASYLIRLQIINDAITPYFLFYYLRSPLYQNFIFGASTGTTRQSANARVITNIELIIPPKEKVLEFENIASVIREKIRSNTKENQKLAALRDLLLPKLMSGEIKV